MNQRYTLIIFLIFVALAVFAWTQRGTESRQVGEGAPTPTPEALLELVPTDIEEVSVAGEDETYELSRVAGGWEVDDEAASDEVDGVVSRLANPRVVRDLPADRNPDDYGFSSVTMTVTLRTAAGDAYVIQVGDETPVDPNVYIRLTPGEGAGADVTTGRIVIVGSSDFNRLRDWFGEPPLAPTPTPEATETPEGEDDAVSDEEADETSAEDESSDGEEEGAAPFDNEALPDLETDDEEPES